MCIGVLVCAFIDVGPSNATKKGWISPPVTSVDAPYYALHPSLTASKAVLSSLSLIVICPSIAPGVTGITGSYHLVPRSCLLYYMYEYIAYVEVYRGTGSPVAYVGIFKCVYTYQVHL